MINNGTPFGFQRLGYVLGLYSSVNGQHSGTTAPLSYNAPLNATQYVVD